MKKIKLKRYGGNSNQGNKLKVMSSQFCNVDKFYDLYYKSIQSNNFRWYWHAMSVCCNGKYELAYWTKSIIGDIE